MLENIPFQTQNSPKPQRDFVKSFFERRVAVGLCQFFFSSLTRKLKALNVKSKPKH